MKISVTAGFTTLVAECDDKKIMCGEPGKGLASKAMFTVTYGNTQIGEFSLEPFPGCCGIIVSTRSFLILQWRGQHHVSTAFHKLKEETAKHLGYSAMIATVELQNFPEFVGACKNGWKAVFGWRSSRTNHELGVIVKKLHYD